MKKKLKLSLNENNTSIRMPNANVYNSALIGSINIDNNLDYSNNEKFMNELSKLMFKYKVNKLDVCWKHDFNPHKSDLK